MRILGIDYGSKRVGLAISDETGTLAQSVGYLDGGSDASVSAAILGVVSERGVAKIVVGLPLCLNGQPSAQTGRTLRFMEVLRTTTNRPVEQWDERLTSVQAKRVLLEGDVRRRDRKEKIDKLAAQIMLQSYLDAHEAGMRDEG